MTPPPADLPNIADPLTFAARAQAWVLWQSVFYAELAAIIGITIPAGSAAAGTLTGNTLAANVLSSSLTSDAYGPLIRGVYDRVVRTAGDITTTSTSLVDVTGATVTFTTGARPVLVCSAATIYGSVASIDMAFNVNVDGTLLLGTGGLTERSDATSSYVNGSFSVPTAALTAAAHTLKLQWKTSSGTATISANSTIAFVFSAHEVR